ncbi:MAG: mechanosensitive ion channel family protein [Bacillaceae bacterium]
MNELMSYFTVASGIAAGKFLLKIVLILIVAKVATSIAGKGIDRFFALKAKSKVGKADESRTTTLSKLIKNIVYYVIYFIVIVTIVGMFGVNLGPILASAGVLGLAIGFGAQGLVKDVVTGFFILFENQYAVGDRVKVNGVEGVVEELGLRTTTILGKDGEMYYLANSSVTQVCNFRNAVEAENE